MLLGIFRTQMINYCDVKCKQIHINYVALRLFMVCVNCT